MNTINDKVAKFVIASRRGEKLRELADSLEGCRKSVFFGSLVVTLTVRGVCRYGNKFL